MITRAFSTTSSKLLFGGVIAAVALASFFALSAFAQEGPEISTTIHNTSHATTTTAAIGTMVHAQARVATTTSSTTPTGTVDFDVYANTSCSGTATSHNGVALVNGVAESSATAVPAAGLSYRVSYNGDSNNVPSESSCVSLTPMGDDVGVSLSLSTTSALVGADVHAQATLQNVTSNASGTVQYTVYSNNSCSSGARDAGTKSVSSASVAQSNTLDFDSVGTFYWRAVYSGDTQNEAATSSCASNALSILATTTGTGRIIVDKVTVPSGANTIFDFNAQGVGYNDFELADGTNPNEQMLTPGTYRISEYGESGWKLTSATCARNGGSATSYSPGSALTLNAGDTLSCVFTNTQSTSTPGHDDDDDDNGNHNGFKCGLPFGIIKKVWSGISLPFGIEKKLGERWTIDEDCEDNSGKSKDKDDDHKERSERTDRGENKGKDKNKNND